MAVVVQAVAQSYSPFFMETATKHSGDVSSLRGVTYRSVGIVLAIGLLASVWLPDVVRFLLPSSYSPTVAFLPCLVGALGLYIVFNLLSLNYNFHKKTLYMPFYTIFSAACSAGLNFFLVPKYGAAVSPYNALATYTILTFVCLWVTARVFAHTPLPPRGASLVVSVYAGLVVLAHSTATSGILHFWVAGGISILVGLLAFFAAGKLRIFKRATT
jgi:hypothetical protein